jgi:thiosulfate dehydrogenase (quinone) large subunit
MMSQTTVSPSQGSARGGRDASQVLDAKLGYFALRLAMGLTMLLHGAVRLSIYGQFVPETVKQLSPTFLPAWSVQAFAMVLPFVETTLGALLLIGLATRWAAFLSALWMLPLMFGMNLLQQWFIVLLQLVFVVFFGILLYFREWNCWSVDALLGHKAGSGT